MYCRWLSAVLLLVCLCALTAYGQQGISFVLKGETYTLNDIVTITDIGVTSSTGDNDGLRATTTHRPCCQAGQIGHWFLPGITTALPFSETADISRIRSDDGEVILNRRNDALPPTGIYTCNIPDSSGVLTNVYIGIYLESTGAPTISSHVYDGGTRTLTCVSGGGPATTVTWRKNCSPLTIDGSVYSQTQTVDTATTTYITTLTIGPSVTDIDGVYSCEIKNRRGRDTMAVGVGADYTPQLPVDVTITLDLATPTAGQPLTMTCSQTTRNPFPQSPVSYQWLDSSGAVLSDNNTLSFTTLRQSHQGEYFCVATVDAVVGCAEYSIVVQDPTVTVNIDDASGNHGESITLSCSASGVDLNGATYSFYDGDKLILAGPSSLNTHSLTAILDTAGGDYYCEVTVSPVYLDVSGPLTVRSIDNGAVSVTIPTPTVTTSFTPSQGPYYTGQQLEISCVTGDFGRIYPGATADISLMGPNGEVITDSRIAVGDVSVLVTDSVFSRPFTFSALSMIDDGSYTCMGTIRPVDPSIQQYVTNGVATADPRTLTVVDPTLDVQITMVTDHILDIAPYNSFSIACTATSSVGGSTVALNKTFTWTRTIDSGSSMMINKGIVNSGLDMASSVSQLTVTTTTAGSHSYSCMVAIDLPTTISDNITNSKMSSLTVQGSTLPLAPVNLMTSGVTHDRATIHWTVPSVSYDRESFVVMFGNDSSLSRSSSSVMGGEDISVLNAQYMVEITGLDMNTQYYYRVQSTNTAGPTMSMDFTFNTTGLGPSPPLSPNSNRNGPINYTFSWSPPTEPNGMITGYQLECVPQPGLSLPTLTNITTDTTLTVSTGLDHGVNYTCTVTAMNEVGPSSPSEPVTFRTDEISPSGPPRVFSRLDSSRGNVDFVWELPLPSLRNGIITGYSLVCTIMGGSEVVSMVLPPDDTNMYSLSGFRVVTLYSCNVSAINSAGTGPSADLTITTGESEPGAPPETFSHTLQMDPTIVTFTWTPPPEDQRNGELTGYQIDCDNGMGSTPSDSGIAGSGRTVDITGFTPANNYTCSIRATTAIGPGPYTTISVITLPSAPSGIIVTSPTSSQLSVMWTASPGVVSYYIVYVNGSERARTSNGSTTSLTVSRLSPFTLYLVEVSAVNDGGEGDRSLGTPSITLEDFPGVVSCMSRWTSHSASSVSVTWSPPENENGVTLMYTLRLVQYGGTGEAIVEANVSSTERNYTLTGGFQLDDGVPYTVEVYAENSVGRGREPCNATDFNVQLAPPTPTGVDSTRNGSTIVVTWNVPTLIEAKGFVSYTVTFDSSNGARRKRQTGGQCSSSPCNPVPVEEGAVVIAGVDPRTAYSFNVAPMNEENVVGVAAIRIEPAVDCGALSDPGNGQVTTSGTVFGNTATYSCDAGYIRNGSMTRTCGADRMWTLSEPTCDRSPPSPASGNLGLIVGATVGVLVVIALVIVIIIIAVCCLKVGRKGKYRPQSPIAMEDVSIDMGKEMSSEHRSSSDGTASPKRQMMSPLHMKVEDFLQPVDLVEFSDYVESMHLSRNKGFERAFQSLPKEGTSASDIAKKNKAKNRFQNIYPYDLCRVKLQELPKQPESDYINASYIDGYGNRRDAYIAAQGPMPNTIGDFWRLIWEHRLDNVVMLTKVKEGTKTKCEMYWPDKVGDTYNPPMSSLSIIYKELLPFADYEIRKFFITDSEDPEASALEVTHYQFLGWPDHGVPEYATALIGFIRRVRNGYNPEGPPMLVHCSAGVGRTGTFIVLDTMLERMKKEDSVNVYEVLRDMRLRRAHMVQTQAQYVFIHDALNELITCGDTEIAAMNIRMRVGGLHKIKPGGEHVSGFNYQYQLLNQVSRKPTDSDSNEALQHYNAHKNRYQDKVPYTSSRVYLKPTGADGGDYINASFIDGYKHRHAYIATQAPLATTVDDFWRMIWEFKSKAIVMLCNLKEGEQETSHLYWPTEVDSPVGYGKLLVTLLSETPMGEGLTVRKFSLTEKVQAQEASAKSVSFNVSQFHYTSWPEHDRPPTTEHVLKISDLVNKVQRSTSNKPITVMCNNGMGRTGAFIAIHAQLEKIKTEALVDLFQFVKSARIHRAGLVAELEHYIFCHDTMADFLDDFETYSNFK